MKTDDMASLNPLIDPNGNTYKVSSVLTFMSAFLQEEQKLEADEAERFGMAMILDTCSAALRHMGEVKS